MRLLYVDTSALFKRYVEEDESEAVLARMEDAPEVGTAFPISFSTIGATAFWLLNHRRSARYRRSV